MGETGGERKGNDIFFLLRCEELKDFLREKKPWTLLGDSILVLASVC